MSDKKRQSNVVNHVFHKFKNEHSAYINTFISKQIQRNKNEIAKLFKINFHLFRKKKPKAVTIFIHQLKTYFFGINGVLIKRIKWLRYVLYPDIYVNKNRLHKKIDIGKLIFYELKDNHNIYNNREIETKKKHFKRSNNFTYDANYKHALTKGGQKHKRKIFLSEDLNNLNNYIMNVTNTFSKRNILLKDNQQVISSTTTTNGNINSYSSKQKSPTNPLAQFDNMYKRNTRNKFQQNIYYKKNLVNMSGIATHIKSTTTTNNNNNTNCFLTSRPRTATKDNLSLSHKNLLLNQSSFTNKRRCQSSRTRYKNISLIKNYSFNPSSLITSKLNDIRRKNISNEKQIKRVFSWGNPPISLKIANFICNPVSSSKNNSQVIISQTEREIKKDVEIALDVSLKGEPMNTYKIIMNKLKNTSDSIYINRILDLSNSVTKYNEHSAYKFGKIIKDGYLCQSNKERMCFTERDNDNVKYDVSTNYLKTQSMVKDKTKYKQRKFLLLKSKKMHGT